MTTKVASDLMLVRAKEKNVDAILKRHNLTRKDLRCSICNEDLSDLKHLGAIFPYGSALICCDKFECMRACRNKLLIKAR